MLHREDNDLLTRTGADTPGGRFMRRYWLPALLEAELLDHQPVRVRLLGESLVAFRTADGSIGLQDERCPHRGASLGLARCEPDGIRCLFHGWKFGPDGNVLDLPTEPEGRQRLKDRIPVRSFRTRIAGGIVWAYLGPPGSEPEFPDFAPFSAGPGHWHASKLHLECNYLQGVEGSLDPAHVSALHSSQTTGAAAGSSLGMTMSSTAPSLEVDESWFGFRLAARRPGPQAGTEYLRITAFAYPCFTFLPGEDKVLCAWVPIDDHHCWQYWLFYDHENELDHDLLFDRLGLEIVDHQHRRTSLRQDGWPQDRAAMTAGHFSGIRGIAEEDCVIQESQGSISDRSTEHLGSSDLGVARMRRMMLRAIRASEEGDPPAIRESSGRYREIERVDEVIPDGLAWKSRISGR
ncbi:Rieske 2Fe-2S domain-containing protein [Geodermatophilus sp. CPCC 205506]|uniref:Rieske 2Fe-2S domain-containing protein n=1 Tax=Geodermatophilus sp. CPCC 205506 TaxID=2936596 RepID=UPI003EEAC156